MTEYNEFWEQWMGSTARPVERIKYRARVTKRDGRKWITYRDELNGRNVIVEMPDNAPTKHCDHGRATTTARTGLAGRPKAASCSSSACPGSSGGADAPATTTHTGPAACSDPAQRPVWIARAAVRARLDVDVFR